MLETLAVATMLFLIMDPLGNLPIFMSVLKGIEPKRKTKVVLRELIIALVILMVFLHSGQAVLDFLQIEQETVSIAGGIILFIIALRMIFPKPGGIMNLPEGEEPFIVPLAVPMIAGPSTMAALILIANQEPNQMTKWSIALFAAWCASALILMMSNKVHKWLGEKGLRAIERLMGMILIMIAIQMLLNGVTSFVHHIMQNS
ncbi:YhgN family NAAT transporter [Glaciecola sp. XM2]|jgi:multiple antibiotic resistance protein|uniref:YhgN family NAAT transporter n=1 Tax=Glaciecola sp. XM2 TaxID=1914931 RepID=UPI001BDF6F44|nr:YhgN family NAAT transporter [Glaciecola sp. XM2]MBT1452168.1 YhgN family NAAT transporter [Glaciecola sp. XM2]